MILLQNVYPRNQKKKKKPLPSVRNAVLVGSTFTSSWRFYANYRSASVDRLYRANIDLYQNPLTVRNLLFRESLRSLIP